MSGRGKGGVGLAKMAPRTEAEYMAQYGKKKGKRMYEEEWGEWDRSMAVEESIYMSEGLVENTGHKQDIPVTYPDSDDEPIVKRKRADSEDRPVMALAPKKQKVAKKPNKAPMKPTAMNLALPKLR